MSLRHIIERRRRLRRVLDYIERHADEEILLADLADQACLSKFHFVRFYAEALRESPLATVRRLRLARARTMLMEGAEVTAAALDCGYASPQAFARAFQRAYGMAPSSVRFAGAAPRYRVRVLTLAPRRIQRLPFADFGQDPGAAFDHLLARAEARGIARAAWTVWSQVDAGLADAASAACLALPAALAQVGAREGALGGGRHLVVRWRGSDRPSAEHLRRLGVAHTGRAPVAGRTLCHYMTDPVFTAPHERLADYYLPLD